MAYTCEQCGAPIRGEDVSEELGIARCAACEAVFPLPQAVAPSAQPKDAPRRAVADLVLPKQMDIAVGGGNMVITWRWFTAKTVLLAVFALFWDGFLVFWWMGALASGATEMLLFSLFHVAVGVGLSYTAVAGFFNTTVLHASAAGLVVTHEPLPWLGAGPIARQELQQLYVEEVVNRGKNGTTITYRLRAKIQGRRDRTLLGGFSKPTPPQIIERAIEDHLGIRDQLLAEEYHRKPIL
ncbi:MAG: hypothetical protein JXX28_06575 [Deltaproteobacteria bacterium]|nr:hypothetical protein [Deltaproteobacteria bacterium]